MFPPAQSGPGGYDMFGPGHTSLSPHPPEESGFSWPSDVGRSQPNVPSSSLHPQFGLGPQNNPHPFNQSFPSNPTPYAHTHTQVELPPPTNLYQQPEGSVSAPDLDVEDAYDKRQRNTAASGEAIPLHSTFILTQSTFQLVSESKRNSAQCISKGLSAN